MFDDIAAILTELTRLCFALERCPTGRRYLIAVLLMIISPLLICALATTGEHAMLGGPSFPWWLNLTPRARS
jgi:hypothetical protein